MGCGKGFLALIVAIEFKYQNAKGKMTEQNPKMGGRERLEA